jgi:argininosuccinate lyase
LQIIKESFLPVFEEIKSCLGIARYMLQNIIINESAVQDNKYKYMFSVEVLNQLVLDGVPFRDAYKQIGASIADGSFAPNYEVAHTHEGSIGNLCTDAIRNMMDDVLLSFRFEKVDIALDKLLGKTVVEETMHSLLS